MLTQTESQEKTSGWSTIDTYVFEGVVRILKDKYYWRRLAPRLRLVNKHWRKATDAHGLHLSMRKLSDYPRCPNLQRICHENNVTSLDYEPQYRRPSMFSVLWEQDLVPELQSLCIRCTINADAVLHGAQVWRSSLRRLTIANCLVTQSGLSALANLVNVTDLQLHQVDHLEEVYDTGCLGKMTQLRRLSVASYSGAWCLDFVSLLTELETLEIYSWTKHIDGLSGIEYCSGLKNLRLSTRLDSSVVDVISRMTQLTALAFPNKDVDDVSFYPLRSIRSLGLLSRRSQILEDELRRILPVNFSWDSLKELVGASSSMFPAMLLDTNMPLTESLTAVNYSGYNGTSFTLTQLTAFRNLQQIRMHYGEESYPLDRNMKDVVFPHVTLWTIDMDLVNAGVFAAKAMPSLKKLGILIRDSWHGYFSFEHLTHLTGLEHISIAGGQSHKVAEFWEAMQEAFAKLPALEHFGWKPQHATTIIIPEELMDFFAEKNVVVDDDDSIFLDD